MGLSCQQLACRRAGRTLFAGIAIRLAPGDALWVQGANGSGKTTLLRMLCGLSQPDRGEVRWQGEPVLAERARYHASLLYLGHADGLKPDWLAWENLALGGLPGTAVSAAAAQAGLAAMGLASVAKTPVRLLSQGQRKRVALARLALAQTRPVWILDEPFASLDQPAVGLLGGVLAQHRAAGGMVVLTTHQEPPLPGAQRLQLGGAVEAPC